MFNPSRFDQGQDRSQKVHVDSTGLCVMIGDCRDWEPGRTQLSNFLWCQLIQKCLLDSDREWTESAHQSGENSHVDYIECSTSDRISLSTYWLFFNFSQQCLLFSVEQLCMHVFLLLN